MCNDTASFYICLNIFVVVMFTQETLQASPSSSRYTFQRTDSVQSLYCKKTSVSVPEIPSVCYTYILDPNEYDQLSISKAV